MYFPLQAGAPGYTGYTAAAIPRATAPSPCIWGPADVVALISNRRLQITEDLEFFLDAFKDLLTYAPVVIGITKMDLKSSPSISMYQHFLSERTLNIPVFEVDGREPNDVKHLVVALLFSIDPGLEA